VSAVGATVVQTIGNNHNSNIVDRWVTKYEPSSALTRT